MNLSLAEHALQQAKIETSVTLTAQEETRLITLLSRNLSPESPTIQSTQFIRLLCTVRRKQWAKRLNEISKKTHKPWIQSEDISWAVSFIHQPDPTDEILLKNLQKALSLRFHKLGTTPQTCYQNLYFDFIDNNPNSLSLEQINILSQDIARAFGLKETEASRFINANLSEEKKQKEKDYRIHQAAKDRKHAEILKQKKWEASLITFKELPVLLRCSPKEILKWIAENKIPVAQRIRKNDKDIWKFDPHQIKTLQPQVSQWRETTSSKKKTNSYINLGDLKVKNKVIANVAAMDRYAAHFITARSLKRQIILVTGPTNSGKSYTALQAMSESESGIALAPLRLLAHEFKEALGERGIQATLKTGEERIIVPNSQFLAATVEMCPLTSPVDVALIDEAQMLNDPDRGAAWTAAIMGVPARKVFVLGSPDCVPMVKNIAKLCEDPCEEIVLNRKSKLQTASSPIPLSKLHAGDALIAFSRRDVLDLRALLHQKGRKVAVIYGALSPEVRRAEAKRFNDGEAEILVATDAIGMGLNLSIKKVIFSTLFKFDGTQQRALTAQEIKQIGGRAGRYGIHETGTVGLLAGAGDPSILHKQLNAPAEKQDDLRPLVQPDIDIVEAIASEIDSDSLYGVLTRLKRAVLRNDDPNYRLAKMNETFAIASALEGVQGLSLRDRWTYSVCPVDDRDNGIQRIVRWAADHAAGKTINALNPGRLPQPSKASRQELERAEKRHKRLIAWRWLSLRFPEVYPDLKAAEEATRKLNEWIEAVLKEQRRKVEL